jgi:uncharacterized protein (DUF697 family)
MSIASVTTNTSTRAETQKLYMTLLQFTLYDNPNKYYSRKLKLKKVQSLHSGPGHGGPGHGGPGSGPTEYIIASSHPNNSSISAIQSDGIKTRKKMKLTSAVSMASDKEQESEPESPKVSKNISSIIEEESDTNIIIFKPIEHEKMKNMKYTLTELRTLCSHYGIKKSGTKPELTQRIYNYLKQSYYIVRIQRNFRNFISSNNTGPGGIIAAMTANKDMNEQLLNIASKESEANKARTAEEAKLGMQASMFNAEQDLKRQGINADINQFNKKLEVGEKQYRREEIMGAIDTAVSRVAGVVKDERMYKATERLAKALDQTKSYDRYEVYEKFVKEKKKKGSPFANMSDYELRLMAAAIVGETTVVPPSGKEGEEGGDNKKLGGVKKYVSRLGDLKYNKVKV